VSSVPRRLARLACAAAALAFAFAVPSTAAPAATTPAAAAAPAADNSGWTPLLDEKLSQWEPYIGVPPRNMSVPGYTTGSGRPIGLRDPKGVFTVRIENGEPVLHITGEIVGGLTTLKEYANYRLRFQFRWGKKRWAPRENAPRDNGILYHCVGRHGAFGNVWMRSVEFQVQENDTGDFWPLCGSMADFPVTRKGGSPWRYTPGAPLVELGTRVLRGEDYFEKPSGEWNDAELVVVGGDSVHILNGKIVNELRNIRYAEGNGAKRKVVPLKAGKLQIQSEFAEAEFRRIEIKPETVLPVAVVKPTGPRVLVYSKTNGYRHKDAIDAGKKFFAKMGQLHGFDADFSEDAAVFTDDSLKKYAAVVLLCTAGEFTMDVPPKKATKVQQEAAVKVSADRREAFRRYVANGGAIAGLHAATDNFSIGGAIVKGHAVWPEYARIIGGAFQHHPQQQTSLINITDPKHPSVKHLKGDTWICFDEWYDFKDLQRDNHVILALDDKTVKGVKVSHYEGGAEAENHPVAWTRTYGKGRVFYTARGHNGSAFGEPDYAQHVLAGLFDALGKPAPVLNPATLPPAPPPPKAARR
jgi:type 1 glutamine amidotransferase